MVLLENDAFLSELTRLYQKAKPSGSVVVTMKRYDGQNKPKPKVKKSTSHPEEIDYKCLFRATVGNKKISTVVTHKDVTKFQMAYANVLKANIDGLKKKAKGKSKTKATKE
ncbi:signal recognition particle 14 kDa protein [Lingula anatina]|uniref:Signal recognition particle 14 kDa protein n=1 Tax=Lingula anatina TaxID=7574 RepID=A0A1S3IPX3_LINAN|nr:signal recognition particle 14 kDa protein [Lingula anatina]|eukprot:XP_013400275.1 signal recognition particle 14 kDa protein [Lingula anatina]